MTGRGVAACVAAAVTITGCAHDLPEASAPPATTPTAITVTAADLTFDQATYTAAAGEITTTLIQQGAVRHSLVIDDVAGGIALRLEVGAGAQGTAITGTVTLNAGTYTIYCDIPGHRQAGMAATLVVD